MFTVDDRFISLFGLHPLAGNIAPPNKLFCESWTQYILKITVSANRILTVLVTAQVDALPQDKTVIGVMRTMYMLSLSSVGLETISWAYKASEEMKMTLSTFLAGMCIRIYRRTVHDIFKVMEFVGKMKQKTYMYQEGALIELSTKTIQILLWLMPP